MNIDIHTFFQRNDYNPRPQDEEIRNQVIALAHLLQKNLPDVCLRDMAIFKLKEALYTAYDAGTYAKRGGITVGDSFMTWLNGECQVIEKEDFLPKEIYVSPTQYAEIRKLGRDFLDLNSDAKSLKEGFMGTFGPGFLPLKILITKPFPPEGKCRIKDDRDVVYEVAWPAHIFPPALRSTSQRTRCSFSRSVPLRRR